MIDMSPNDNSNAEIDYWRYWFLRQHSISDGYVINHFLGIPPERFVLKTPLENLVDCMAIRLDQMKKEENDQ